MFIKKFKSKKSVPKTRKQLRKEDRKNKKVRRNEFYTNRNKPGKYVLAKKGATNSVEEINSKETKQVKNVKSKQEYKPLIENERQNEKKRQARLEKDMKKARNTQLVEANFEEDKNIKRLEKQLKLHKRKSKGVAACFSNDGLDYLLEVCDSENLQNSALAEQELSQVNEDFGEDFELMTGKQGIVKQKKTKRKIEEEEIDDEILDSDEDLSNLFESDDEDAIMDEENVKEESEDEEKISEGDEPSAKKLKTEENTWEDIYGRLRTKDGGLLSSQKYIPPAARLKTEDQKLERLRKQLKGLINRLAESNLHNIATQIEELYMNNSRNDMNVTITNLVISALVTNILAPERLLMEHILLIIILHANVGTEVGAHFLQTVTKLFDENLDTQNKSLDNIVIILSQLYNFKLFESKLIYEIIQKLAEKFDEKSVECILHILRNVGFNLRKDDPIALKNVILDLQKKASNVDDSKDKVKFMLEILLAIKNNNVTKIPNYDTSYAEHLKKIMKGFIRKGNYVTQLNISLEDLLKAEEKGKWWVIGSAWAGNSDVVKTKETTNTFSQKLLSLASKQRMNTDARKNIFCIIMSAEDYLDAFEKLLKLSLKNQQEREIIHVILHCCLQEKTYNPYYATLAQKFCEYDRKFQMIIKCSIWDKLKALNDQSATHISHLAKLLSFLFMEKGLPISTLKIVQFSELDKVTLRFIRQILLAILLCEDVEICREVFDKVAHSDKLKMFRESLRLFLHHFLLRNLDSHGIDEDKKVLLQQRVKIVEKILTGRESKLRY